MDREEADSSRKELGRSAQRYFGLARRLLKKKLRGAKVATSEKKSIYTIYSLTCLLIVNGTAIDRDNKILGTHGLISLDATTCLGFKRLEVTDKIFE